jgi:Fe-S-cluster-containing dehydrogenase component
MSAFVIDHDQKRCIGCQACEVHCKAKNDLPAGPRNCRIIPVESGAVDGIPRLRFVFMSCFCCEEAGCVAECPTGAMQKRSTDGIVFVDADLCVGCQSCIAACPWGAPQWNAALGKVVKCDFCKDRVDQGLKPACVVKCTAHALRFVRSEEVSAHKREKSAGEHRTRFP